MKKLKYSIPNKSAIFPKLIASSLARSLACIGLVFFFTTSCNKHKDEPPNLSETSFDQVMESGGVPEKVARVEEELAVEEKEELREDGSLWLCSVRTISVEDGNADFPLFNPNASVIYPGSLLQGKTLKNASPSVIPVKRGGGRISIDIIDGSEQPAFSVDEVSKSNIATAANQIIGKSTGKIPANFNFTYDEIKSEEHLAFGLGLDVKSQFAEVSAKFSFTKDESYSHFLVKLNQSFYTLSFDIPTSYSELFAPEVTPAELAKYVGTGNPATFISDVTYGRIYYMLIESTSSSLDIQAKLEASFSGGVTSGGVDLNTEYLKSLSNLKIKVVAFGGESGSTFETIGETDISKLASLFGQSSDISTGVPISYVVRDAVNKEVVNVKLATEYDVKECKPVASALGEPAILLDAITCDLNSPYYKPFSTEDNGKFRYYGPHDSFAMENPGASDGTVVRMWHDSSGNDLHASSVSNEPDSRPMFVPNAFDNGLPAIEFFRGQIGNDYIFNRLTYSGGVFANTDYTIFMVVAYHDKVKIEWRNNGAWVTGINVENRKGNFLTGTQAEPNRQLIVGFPGNSFRFSHYNQALVIDDGSLVPTSKFQVVAVRFSQTEGMSVYSNGKLIGKNAFAKNSLLSNAGAMICAPVVGDSHMNYARVRIGELRAYKVAATEAQIIQEMNILNQKFGL